MTGLTSEKTGFKYKKNIVLLCIKYETTTSVVIYKQWHEIAGLWGRLEGWICGCKYGKSNSPHPKK